MRVSSTFAVTLLSMHLLTQVQGQGHEYVSSHPDISEFPDGLRSFLLELSSNFRTEDQSRAVRHKVKRVCSLRCQHGTIFYQGGTCSCICRKNYAKHHVIKCIKASWASWSSWTKCLRADWGGLQRRERVCKARGKETPGACDGRGSMARTCTRVTKDFKIRKNVKDLTDYELHDLIQAMTKFKKDRSKKGYRNIVSWHGYPGRCHWYHSFHSDNHCSWHHHPMFQPWHRLIVVQLELGLSRYLKNKTFGIPFWDWTEHASDIPYLLRNPKIYDPILHKFVKNPFHSTFIKYWEGVKMYNQRHPWYPGLLMDRYILKGTVRALLSHDYYAYDEQQSTIPHDQIHDCFCVNKKLHGESICDFGMPTVTYAAWDPAFLIHHSAMDRLFVMKRTLEESFGLADWTKSRVIGQYQTGAYSTAANRKHAFDWPMSPFCNKSMNPEPLTGRKGFYTMHNAYYNEQLFGYRYADFDLGHGYTWEDLNRDYEKNVIRKSYWNDEYFATKIGPLTKANCYSLKMKSGCAWWYSNPKWTMSVVWN